MLAAANARGEAIVLRPSRRRWALALVASLVFTVPLALSLAAGVYVIQVLGLLLFGSGVVFSVLHLVPGRAYLRIAPDGLVVRAPFTTQRWAWNDVERFRGYEIHHRGTVPVGLVYTFLTPGTSIGAHVGGLVAGLAVGRAFERPGTPPATKPREVSAPGEH